MVPAALRSLPPFVFGAVGILLPAHEDILMSGKPFNYLQRVLDVITTWEFWIHHLGPTWELGGHHLGPRTGFWTSAAEDQNSVVILAV